MEIHYKRHLKKLNRLNELEEKKTKKCYGKKDIEIGYEKRIKEAIDNLKDLNSNITEEQVLPIKEQTKIKIPELINKNNKLFLNNNNEKNINENINTNTLPKLNNIFNNNETPLKLNLLDFEKNLFKDAKEPNLFNTLLRRLLLFSSNSVFNLRITFPCSGSLSFNFFIFIFFHY